MRRATLHAVAGPSKYLRSRRSESPNRPFSVALEGQAFAGRDFSRGSFVKSAAGLLRRLDQLSCQAPSGRGYAARVPIYEYLCAGCSGEFKLMKDDHCRDDCILRLGCLAAVGKLKQC